MLKKQKTLYLGLARECSGGGSASQVALLSVTTAPSGSFAVGSKYYNSSTKKIVTAVTADTWTGATSADPVFNVIYTFNSGYYAWDGNSLELTDLNLYEKVANKTDSYTETSPTKYPSSKALSDGLGSVVVPDASNTVKGIIRIATDGEASAGTLENVGVNPKQLATKQDILFLVPKTITPVSGTATVVLENSKVVYEVTPVKATTLIFDVSGLTIPSGNYIAFNLTLNMSAGVQTITFPASVQWGNVSPTLTSAVKYMFSFFSPDGGTTWIGNQSASWIVGA
jgi:hypothetical protein